MNKFVINDVAWAKELENGLGEYMDSIQNWFVYGEDNEGEEPEVLSGEPYCGCETCWSREILFYVAPRIMAAQNDKKIELI